MNLGQQIFSVFYAVLYGAMLSSVDGLRPFQWGSLMVCREQCHLQYRLCWRLMFSFLFLNLVPLIIFTAGFKILASFNKNQISFCQTIAIAMASLSVFAPYRFYHAFMVWTQNKKCALYNLDEYKKIKEERKIGESVLGQCLGCLFYLALFCLLFFVN